MISLPVLKIILIIAAYLIGSFSSAVWISKYFYNMDIRDFGSGNAGAANTFRVLGPKAGVPVFLLDMLKGFIAVKLLVFTRLYIPGSADFITFQLVLGGAAVIGHVFPIFSGFKGGKGVATLLGIVLAIDPLPTIVCIGVFGACLLLTRYVSLSSIVASIAFPIAVIFIFKTNVQSLIVFSLITTILILLTHQKNIERLIRKEEAKANLFKRKNKTRRRRRLLF